MRTLINKFKKYRWPLFFFLLGAISIISQTLFLREITTLFYGNEFFYSFGLGFWLLFTGCGSLLAARFNLLKNKTAVVWTILGGLPFLLIILVILLRWMIAAAVPVGELSGLGLSFSAVSLMFLIFCLPLGAIFPLAVFDWRRKNAANQGYLWETLGFAFGGLFFSFILATTQFPLTTKLSQLTLRRRYPGITSVINSKYNQIVVSQAVGQKNFFLSGQLTFTTQESLETEQLLTLIAPFAEKSGKSLVLGSPNLAKEIKESLGFDKVDFLELDGQLLKLEKDLLGKGVSPVIADPRRFLNKSKERWDLIIFAPGNPQTLLGNRYFTQECFESVKKRLSENGIFVLTFYLPTDYQSKEATLYASSIHQTLNHTFPFLELLTPQDQLIFILGNSEVKIKKPHTGSLRQDYFWDQVEDEKRHEILKNITVPDVEINTDFNPVAFFYQQLFWQTIFSFKLPKLFLGTINFLPLLLLVLFIGLVAGNKKGVRLGILAAVSSSVLMSLEILIITMFQTKIGYLYSQIGLIFASVLLGMAGGIVFAKKAKKPLKALRISFLSYLAIIFFFYSSLKIDLASESFFWLGLGFVSGSVGGAIFALVNRLYLKDKNNPGFIYAFDLFGAFLSALLTSAFLLPAFGVEKLLLGLGLAIGLLFFGLSVFKR